MSTFDTGQMGFWRKELIDVALDHETRVHIEEQLAWIAREPSNARPYYHLAQFYRMNGKQDEARGLLLEAVRLDPGHGEAHAGRDLCDPRRVRAGPGTRPHRGGEWGAARGGNAAASRVALDVGRLSPLETLRDIDHADERVAELPAHRRQAIPDGRRGGRPRHSVDHAFVLQLAQSRCEHLRRNPLNIRAELGETTLSFAEIPDHMCRPGAGQQPHALPKGATGRERRRVALSSLDHGPPYQMVTRFFRAPAERRIGDRRAPSV
jgi:hypothetical protein